MPYQLTPAPPPRLRRDLAKLIPPVARILAAAGKCCDQRFVALLSNDATPKQAREAARALRNYCPTSARELEAIPGWGVGLFLPSWGMIVGFGLPFFSAFAEASECAGRGLVVASQGVVYAFSAERVS